MNVEQQTSVDAPDGAHLIELWSDREEVHALPEILKPGEGLVCVGSGTVLRSGRLAHPRWLVVLTSLRLLCIKGRVAVTRKVIEMPVSAIRSVDRKRLLRSTLVVETGYGTLRITGMKNANAAEIAEGIQAIKTAADPEAGRVAAIPRANLDAPARAGSDDRLDQLEQKVERLQSDLANVQDQLGLLADVAKQDSARH